MKKIILLCLLILCSLSVNAKDSSDDIKSDNDSIIFNKLTSYDNKPEDFTMYIDLIAIQNSIYVFIDSYGDSYNKNIVLRYEKRNMPNGTTLVYIDKADIDLSTHKVKLNYLHPLNLINKQLFTSSDFYKWKIATRGIEKFNRIQ